MRRLVLLLIGILLLTGCSGASDIADTAAAQDAASDGVAAATVTDGAGRVLEIPENREELTIASVYAVSVPFIVALELSDRVVAINVKSRFWTDSVAGLAKAGSVGRGVVDMEALAGFAPDVLIHRSNDAATVENVTERLGVPVLCIEVENYDDIIGTLELMGTYFGAERRAAEVSGWLTGKFDIIDRIVGEIPAARRVTALVMGSQPYRVAGGDMLQPWMVEKAGGISVVPDIANNRNWVDIGTEKVFDLDPDFIFCTSSTPLDYAVGDLISDGAWQALTAVVNKNIHIIPAAMDSWDLPGISAALGTMFMLHKMYPDYFTEDELEREIEEYYAFMFGQTFDYEYLGIGDKGLG